MRRRNARFSWRKRGRWFASLLFFFAPFANAQLGPSKKVLLLEDQTSAPAIDSVAREFLLALDAKSADPIDYYRESLDTVLIPDEDYQEEVRGWYERKYAKHPLELIVAVGPESSAFLRKVHKRFFPGIKVVFFLDIKPESNHSSPEQGLTGVWMDLDPGSTIEVARQLVPNTKQVAVVAGTGRWDKRFLEVLQKKLLDYQGLEFIYLTDLDFQTLLKRIASLPKSSIILYLTVTGDRARHHFFARDTLPQVSGSASVPVFGLFDASVGRGLVGGRVTDFAERGTQAAEMASQILAGRKPEDIPVATATNQYAFDWKALQRWGINTSRLPTPSTVINREPNLRERYRQVIIAVLVILLLETGLVFYLIVERKRRLRAQAQLEHDIAERKKTEEALMNISSRLISAQEEERSRIARELHDDFNQRLGMLAIDLERTALIIPKEPDKAVHRLHQLWNQITLLEGDLNKLSHTLHSSVLDFLGFAEGIRSLGQDSTEHQGEALQDSASKPDTAKLASEIKAYSPDKTWRKVRRQARNQLAEKEMIMKKMGILALALVLLGATGTLAQDVGYNFARGEDFWKYKTYKWVSIKNAQQVDEITAKQLTTAIEAGLATKGLTKTDSDNADLYIGYQTAVGSQQQINA